MLNNQKRAFRRNVLRFPGGDPFTPDRKTFPTGGCSAPQTVTVTYVKNGDTYSRLTQTKQFWRVQVPELRIFLESTRPEFDVGLQLESRGFDPSVSVEFYRDGERVLTYPLKECVRGYWADTFNGPVYVTRQKHEGRKERMARFRSHTTPLG